MKVNPIIGRFAAIAGAAIALVMIILFSLSYYDVRAAVGPKPVSLVGVAFGRPHLIEARWRVGKYDTDHDFPGRYVYWTLRPRQVMYVKG